MAEAAVVSVILKQLGSILAQEAFEKVKLIASVKKDVEKLRSKFVAIQGVLSDAEKKQLKDQAVRQWLGKLKYASYDIEDVLDEWTTKMMELEIQRGHDDQNALACLAHLLASVCSFFPSSCFDIKEVFMHHHFACKIKELNENLDEIHQEREKYQLESQPVRETQELPPTTSFGDVSNMRPPTTSFGDVLCGRDKEKNELVDKLLSESSATPESVKVISLIGMGGIGKTALAQYACNHENVTGNFRKRIWVCVSNPFDRFRIAKEIIEKLGGSTPDLKDMESLGQLIGESVFEKKFLLILDDVWINGIEGQNEWKPFYQCLNKGARGSKILITSRDESVAYTMKSSSTDIINVGSLSFKDNWSIFEKLAFHERPAEEQLIKIGEEIVRKCDGFPLATKTIGNLLRLKRTRQEWQDISDSDFWWREEVGKEIYPLLLLSYNDLPSKVKPCFLYCSIFPKDCRMEKDILIKLWMAQGYLGSENNDSSMEINGEDCFTQLAIRSFFQEFKRNDNNEVTSCKMHDIVHDFALYLSNKEYLAKEVHGREVPFAESSYKEVRHLRLTLSRGAKFPTSIHKFKRLRSLLIECKGEQSFPSEVLSELFSNLICLRTLKLDADFNAVKEIPEEINRMKLLKYLDFKNQRVKQLPESLCELHNLQTLNIASCEAPEFPQEIEKLVNLRYFFIDVNNLRCLPVGIERLTCLRTLNEFIVGDKRDGRKACTLDSLKDLNHLRGRILIKRLGRFEEVTNVSEGEMIEALKNKKNLTSLDLEFRSLDSEGGYTEQHELVLNALQFPPNLNNLAINYYKGYTLPSNWTMSTPLTELPLVNLKKLNLNSFIHGKNLRPLGKLPSLEFLRIEGPMGVEKVDNIFWGIGSEATSSSSSPILYPKLEQFILYNLNWRQWDYEEKNGGENIAFMPCLATLQIIGCASLEAVPGTLLQRKTLKQFKINASTHLEKRYSPENEVDWLKIFRIPNIIIGRNCVQGRFFM